jgi:hypothetical protein
VSCGDFVGCVIGVSHNVQMFTSILFFWVDQFGQQGPNYFISGFNLPILRIIFCKSNILEQKMSHRVNDGVIDEVCSLANDHYERVKHITPWV